MATGTVRVRGLKEMTRAFKRISKELDSMLVLELKDAGEDVRKDAEDLALGKITNMPRSPRWAGMKITVNRAQGLVSMVPAARSARRKGGSRPNLANLLLDRAMDPAKEKNAAAVVGKVEDLIDRLGGANGF